MKASRRRAMLFAIHLFLQALLLISAVYGFNHERKKHIEMDGVSISATIYLYLPGD